MKNAENHITDATADERSPDVPSRRSGEAMPEATDAHRLNLARSLRLGRLLHVRVLVDESGLLRGDIEIAYQRERGNTIRPITVRVGLDVRDEDVLADGGAVAVCRRYNSALAELGQLAIKLATIVHAAQMTIHPGSLIAQARRELDGLDAIIAARQAKHMGHGTVRLRSLMYEIAFLEDRHAHLATIVSSAESEVSARWDGDTQDVDPDD